jgi:cytochrome c-type biogenesis protein CcmH/NrfF
MSRASAGRPGEAGQGRATRAPLAALLLAVFCLVLAGVVTLATAATVAVATVMQPGAGLSGDALDAATRSVSAELRCPVCQGESIQDSPADLAVEMRAVVRDQLAAGRTPDEVKAYFVARYGEWILLAPPARGFNLVLYILPFVLLAGGGALLFVLVRRWQRRGAATQPAQRPAYIGPDDDEY